MKNLLVHLCNSGRMKEVLQRAIRLASAAQANVRGVSIVDTRRTDEPPSPAAVGYYVVGAARASLAERRQTDSRAAFLELCRRCGVRGDLRHQQGDPLDVLVDEARYHDLTVAGYGGESRRPDGGLSAQELIELAQRITHPLLVLRRQPVRLDRVLLVYDGTNAASRAIRAFAAQSEYLGNEYRLVCVGEAADPQSGACREMAQYCRSHIERLETGCLPGSPLKTVAKYAEKWEADLLVLGVTRSPNWWGTPLDQLSSDILLHSEFPIYASA